VLTERIARLQARGVTLQQVDEALAVAVRVREAYEPHVAKLRDARDKARAKVAFWQERVATAEARGAPDLAEQARDRLAKSELIARDVLAVLVDVAAGQQRLADAINELRRLARRVERSTSEG
jgi:hypothetical protein